MILMKLSSSCAQILSVIKWPKNELVLLTTLFKGIKIAIMVTIRNQLDRM